MSRFEKIFDMIVRDFIYIIEIIVCVIMVLAAIIIVYIIYNDCNSIHIIYDRMDKSFIQDGVKYKSFVLMKDSMVKLESDDDSFIFNVQLYKGSNEKDLIDVIVNSKDVINRVSFILKDVTSDSNIKDVTDSSMVKEILFGKE